MRQHRGGAEYGIDQMADRRRQTKHRANKLGTHGGAQDRSADRAADQHKGVYHAAQQAKLERDLKRAVDGNVHVKVDVEQHAE